MSKLWASPSATAWTYILIQIGSSIGVVPILVANFPVEEAAFWLMVSTIISIAALADFGFAQTVVRVASFYYAGVVELPTDLDSLRTNESEAAEPNYAGLALLSGTTERIYSYLGLIALLALTVYGLLLSYQTIAASPAPMRLYVSLALIVLVGVVNIVTSRHVGFLQGVARIHRVNRLRVIVLSVELVLMVVAASLSLGVPYLCAILLGRSLYILYYTRRQVDATLLPHVSATQIRYDESLFKAMWEPTKKQGGLAFGSYFVNHGSSIVVSQTGSPLVISSFFFAKRILDAGRTLTQVPFAMNVNEVFASIATRDLPRARHDVARYIGLSFWLLLSFCALYILCSPATFAFLGMSDLTLPLSILGIMTISLLLEMHHSFHALLYLSTNQVPFFWGGLLSGVAIVALGWVASGPYGVIGLVTTQFIIQLIYNNWYPVHLSLKLLEWPFANYVSRTLALDLGHGK